MDALTNIAGQLRILRLILCLCLIANLTLAHAQQYGQNLGYGQQNHAGTHNPHTHVPQSQPNWNQYPDQPNGNGQQTRINGNGQYRDQSLSSGQQTRPNVNEQSRQPSQQNWNQHRDQSLNSWQPTSANGNGQSGQPGQQNGYQRQDQSNGQQTGHNAYRKRKPSPRTHVCRKQDLNYDCIFQDVVIKYGYVKHIFGNLWDAQSKNITFERSRMDYLPKSLMDAFPDMETLNAESLQIQSLQPKAFENANRLQRVYLANNLIEEIRNDSFYGASNIALLFIERNRIKHVAQYAVYYAPYLIVVSFSFNRIPSLPTFVYNQFLEVVNASHNAITRVEEGHFAYNSNLRYLDLSFNELSYFNMNQLHSKLNLQKVDVSSNQLTEIVIPAYVKVLYANNNSIERLYTDWQLCKVKQLHLSRNKLKQQPDLSKCSNLRRLDLSFNDLESFNFTPMQSLQELTYLNLENNRLLQIELPTQFSYPLPLQILDLSSNKISSVANTQALNMLVELYLHSNELVSFDFLNKPYIQRLALANNQWDCAVLNNVDKWKVIDNQQGQCRTGFHNEGICCQSVEEQDSQILKNDMEKVREIFIHELANRKSVDDHCRTEFSHNQQQMLEVNEKLKYLASLETSKDPIHREIASLNDQISQVGNQIATGQMEIRTKNDQIKALEKEIDRWRAHYGIEKEGLVSGRTVFDRIIKFVAARNKVTDGLLKRRQDEVSIQQAEEQKKLTLIETTKEDLEKFKEISKEWKLKEQAAKKELNLLAAQVNKNSPSQRG